MRLISLEYHDVVQDGAFDSSGFPGRSAASYKLRVEDFREHLLAIGRAVTPSQSSVSSLLTAPRRDQTPVLLTFDDGGRSAHGVIADLLEAAGWRGHFLVTTDRIGHPTFLGVAQIRDLRRRGHVVGSHSCSHPLRMDSCSSAQLLDEWRRSTGVLADILGEPVSVASVPGGGYALPVAEAAARAGIRVLFSSEPTTRTRRVRECLLVGRYTLRRSSSATMAARFAGGDPAPRAAQWLEWNAKKLLKRAAGPLYLQLRNRILDGRAASGVS